MKFYLHRIFVLLSIIRISFCLTCTPKETYPYMFGGHKGPTKFTAFDMDLDGNIAVGGYSSDSDLLSGTYLTTSPILAYYTANGLQQWANSYSNAGTWTGISAVAFCGPQRICFAPAS
jgi:hypothetical protein